MMSAISSICASRMPRVVTAGVPSRRPLHTVGFSVSKGMVFLFTVIMTSSNSASASLPVKPRDALTRSEEHTSELQSRENLVCRLLLDKKNLDPCFAYYELLN